MKKLALLLLVPLLLTQVACEKSDKELANNLSKTIEAAINGDKNAQLELSKAFNNKGAIPQDYQKAIDWLSKAAEQGNAVAQGNMAFLYGVGYGVQKDAKKSRDLLNRSAEQGNAMAQSILGLLYSEGSDEIPQDNKKAVEWLAKAAKQGEETAQYNLGMKYGMGLGVEQDSYEAFVWLTIATMSIKDEEKIGIRDMIGRNLSPEKLGEAKAEAEKRFAEIEANKK